MKTKYELIADALRQKIMDHDYEVGDQLPQETVLGKAYNASRITIRRALDELQTDGLIYKIQGAGTFVKNNELPDEGPLPLDLIPLDTVTIEAVDFAVVKAPSFLKPLLNVNDYDFVYEIKRRFSQAGQPVAFNHIWMPIKLIQGMRLDVIKDSLYDFISNDLDLSPESAKRQYTVIEASQAEAEQLNVAAETPLLRVKQQTYLSEGRMFEYAHIDIVTARYQLEQTLA
ncbi:GntR family transcriptional regulator [Lacticaseibacillus suibinensis]|uniref:GntR family transcriptional regulator n=1 Tax=Lacticaseibacillus suibinensis TaxID=2486011 RepID=UPI000F783AC8|nr:GntR family transcriptional regulator [Lacticaseibacillus suibinensis]